jgi:hypothetical protein
MVSHGITLRVPRKLWARLRNHSRVKGQTPSELVRVALESYLAEGTSSAYDLAEAAGLIGCVRRAPKDLSTNRQHFENPGQVS